MLLIVRKTVNSSYGEIEKTVYLMHSTFINNKSPKSKMFKWINQTYQTYSHLNGSVVNAKNNKSVSKIFVYSMTVLNLFSVKIVIKNITINQNFPLLTITITSITLRRRRKTSLASENLIMSSQASSSKVNSSTSYKSKVSLQKRFNLLKKWSSKETPKITSFI